MMNASTSGLPDTHEVQTSEKRIAVRLRGATKRFAAPSGASYTAVEGIDMEIEERRFISIVGPSGCGKSTILNIAAGLDPPTSGTIEIFGEPLRGINARAGYMFQYDALLPWKTVLDNVLLGPTFRNRASRERAREWLKRVGLEGFENYFPYQLSGGMRKRVAMAQNWIINPDILLMDEPFSALDVHTRHKMESELLELWSAERDTVIFVTHDLEEAVALADRVVVLSAGPASHVIGSYEVPLSRPRELLDIRTRPEFIDLYRLIWADLREEVIKSYARGQK
jgi:NitT/TauT family transport system ATP-binding protein